VLAALTLVQNDGSLGIHNYAYADALLTAAERGLSELSVPGAVLRPTEAPAPTATPSASSPPSLATGGTPVPGGFRPITMLAMGVIVLILFVLAGWFFRESRMQER
jgi:hypothetical protein